MTLYRKLCRFVYVGSGSKPEPQIWYGDDHRDGNGKPRKVLLSIDITEWHEHFLSQHGLSISIDNLARIYPYETPLV